MDRKSEYIGSRMVSTGTLTLTCPSIITQQAKNKKKTKKQKTKIPKDSVDLQKIIL